MAVERVIVTGASGFIGRHLLDAIKDKYRVFGLGRRSQKQAGAPIHPNISWFQVDIGEKEPLAAVFREIEAEGGADVLVHLAVHYDFTGKEHPEYWRTNVEGLRNVLELSKTLDLRRFIFTSSVAACDYPDAGSSLNELSPPNGKHIYAVTKRKGEEMLREYQETIPSCIVRLAAIFSDWCEYPPLFMFLRTWLSDAWSARILAGRGTTAIPYLHVRDAVSVLRRLIENPDLPTPREAFIAGTDGAVSHKELYDAATTTYFAHRREAKHLPKFLCWPGTVARDTLRRMLGDRPFERTWMCSHIDRQLTVDATRTRQRLGWNPRRRLEVIRRIPFMMENLRSNPLEWHRLNYAAMRPVVAHPNLVIHRLLEAHQDEIASAFDQRVLSPEGRKRLFVDYQRIGQEERRWYVRLLLRNLMNAVRTREKAVFQSYCRELAEKRLREGFTLHEVCDALNAINQISLQTLSKDPGAEGMEQDLHDLVTMTVSFGIDQVQEVFEEQGASQTGTRTA